MKDLWNVFISYFIPADVVCVCSGADQCVCGAVAGTGPGQGGQVLLGAFLEEHKLLLCAADHCTLSTLACSLKHT